MGLFNISRNKKEDSDTETITVYEYGNGVYAQPFQDRVKQKINNIKSEYIILETLEYKHVPSHSIGKNCFGMDIYKCEELEMKLLVKRKDKSNMDGNIDEAIRLLRQNGYFVKKIPAKLDKVSKECCDSGYGECVDCNCFACLIGNE